MSNDPLDAVFVTGEEAQQLKRESLIRRLAKYLRDMPPELKPLFREKFHHVNDIDHSAQEGTNGTA